MPALHIDPSESALPSAIIPPKAGSSPAEWAAYRDAARAAGVYRVAMAVSRRESEGMPSAKPRWDPIPRRLLKSRAIIKRDPPELNRDERMALVMRDHMSGKRPSVRFIQAVCCAYYGISREDLVGASREVKFTYPRHISIYLSRELTPHSLPKLCTFFDKRDHTTILHSYRKILKELSVESSLSRDVNEIRAAVMGGGE